MNGRIYDPTLGRFLQADPHIQAPSNSQSYNRYSYVLNNPMSYTDPSGYFFKKLLKTSMKITGTGHLLRSIAKTPWLNSLITVGLNFIPGCQVWCSAVYTAASTFAVTGSLNAGIKAGAIAYATGKAFQEIGNHFSDVSGGGGADINFGGNMLTETQVSQQIAAHAIVGGVSSSLNGGKFGHGFFSAGVTKGLGGAYLPAGSDLSAGEVAYGTFTSMVIGGTASVISGGKFENGAKTAAMQYLYNQLGKVNYSKIWKDVTRTLSDYWGGVKSQEIEVFRGALNTEGVHRLSQGAAGLAEIGAATTVLKNTANDGYQMYMGIQSSKGN